jgi:methylated-DNA-[protein]-cysteine S-methyltransferase
MRPLITKVKAKSHQALRKQRVSHSSSTMIRHDTGCQLDITKGTLDNHEGLAILESKGRVELTAFRWLVLSALCQVPKGSVTTYHALARHIQCRSAQAVGQALRHNPYAPAVPCHRVVAAKRSMGGFSGQRQGALIDKKIALLQSEGVLFDSDGRVSESCLYQWT